MQLLENSIGSIINYFIGYQGEEYLLKKNYIKKNSFQKLEIFFNKYGGYTLLLSFMPIIGDPITLIAGAAKYNKKKFIILILISKGGRYLFIIAGYFFIS